MSNNKKEPKKSNQCRLCEKDALAGKVYCGEHLHGNEKRLKRKFIQIENFLLEKFPFLFGF